MEGRRLLERSYFKQEYEDHIYPFKVERGGLTDFVGMVVREIGVKGVE